LLGLSLGSVLVPQFGIMILSENGLGALIIVFASKAVELASFRELLQVIVLSKILALLLVGACHVTVRLGRILHSLILLLL
jgi:hypothetical protein